MDIKKLKNFYKNKRVFVTGHTGFKGTWLIHWLLQLGAKVCGYALAPDNTRKHFTDTDVVPLGNEPIVRNGLIIGKTTSAAFGYRVARPVAIALIEKAIIADGVIVQVDIAGVMANAVISVAPLFDPSGSRMRTKRS